MTWKDAARPLNIDDEDETSIARDGEHIRVPLLMADSAANVKESPVNDGAIVNDADAFRKSLEMLAGKYPSNAATKRASQMADAARDRAIAARFNKKDR